jgi:hypothetical protein
MPTTPTAACRAAGARRSHAGDAILQWLAKRLAGVALLVIAFAPAGHAQVPATASERTVKAAFVYKFLSYVEWPAAAAPGAPLVIGVVGADEFAAELAELVRGRTVNDHPIEVRRVRPSDPLTGLNVLFTGAAEQARLAALARAAAARGVLTISEGEDGLDRGSVINFVVIDGRVRFEVSLEAAERAGIRLSSRLLAVAHFVRMGTH